MITSVDCKSCGAPIKETTGGNKRTNILNCEYCGKTYITSSNKTGSESVVGGISIGGNARINVKGDFVGGDKIVTGDEFRIF